MIRRIIHTSPGKIIFLSVIGTILAGTALLALPFARTQPIALFDLFFTATSATCVTGLLTIPLDHFTLFGHAVILILIQIGGLGLITLSLAIMSLFIELGYSTQVIAVQLLELESWQNIKRLIAFIIMLTLSLELIGTLCTFISLSQVLPIGTALFYSLFHAVSSFCNAGFTLFTLPITSYPYAPILLITTTMLMFLGGLGFVTCHEIMYAWAAQRKGLRYTISLHSKIALYGSLVIILAGTLIFLSLEQSNIAQTSPLAFLTALFNIVSFRSTGFSTIAFTALHPATLLLIMILAFIGTAPASTGSGVKVTTITVFLATIQATITGRSSVDIRMRRIPLEQVFKAFTIISLSILWILFTTFFLLITERTIPFSDLLFESVSAYATLGVSSGITASLTYIGKLIIIASMIIGRVGSLTLILALRSTKKPTEYTYPEERIMLS